MGQEHLGAVCNFSSCKQGASWCHLQFQLMQAISIWCRLKFQLVQARSVLVPFVVSTRAGKERLLSPFRLVWTMSFGCRYLCLCGRGTLVSPFRLVRTRSVGVSFSARVDQERCCRI
ncbi:hypothetical protein ACFX13_002509 [Malus domestica]